MDDISTEVVALRRQLEKAIANEVCKVKDQSCEGLKKVFLGFLLHLLHRILGATFRLYGALSVNYVF